MPLEKSVRLAVILGTIPDLAIRIKSSLFEKWVDLVKKVGGFKIFLEKLEHYYDSISPMVGILF
jgi:hypothetical protein